MAIAVGYDARRKSDLFALDTARVAAAAGVRVHAAARSVADTGARLVGRPSLGAAGGVMVTASHNPPADNGYKVYLGDGAQISPPHDARIAERIVAVDPTAVDLADEDDDLIVRLDGSIVDRYVASMRTVRLRPATTGVLVAYTPMHGVGGELTLRAFDAAGLPAPVVVDEQFRPDPTVPDGVVPEPGGTRARWTS